jgi:hypothetical protein
VAALQGAAALLSVGTFASAVAVTGAEAVPAEALQ